MPEQWCVIVFRNLPCREYDPDHPELARDVLVDDPVTVYGPFSKREAAARVEQFNRSSVVPNFEDCGPDAYRPVANAPAYLEQETWNEYWARMVPMNDVPW
jgi:hypothetical protein